MEDESERLIYIGVGLLAALVLGVLLMPLRELIPASNLTFAFLVLTIAVAELGGRWAAVATALSSALSLDFLLIRPYGSLAIEDKNDVIAFLGLAVCGLIVAAFAARRRQGVAARAHFQLLCSALGRLEQAGPIESRLTAVLETCLSVLPIATAAVRDRRGEVLARAGRSGATSHSGPLLEGDTLRPQGEDGDSWRDRGLPPSGARIALVVGRRQVGWLDVWGDGEPASPAARRALTAAARVLAALLMDAQGEADLPEGSVSPVHEVRS